MDKLKLTNTIDKMDSWLREVRRDFHMHPELGGQEFRTSEKIKVYLDGFGIEYKSFEGSTGVVGLIKGAFPGKTVAIRADMDALPIFECNETEYKSQNAGVMHACGHDAHTAILLGTARYFAEVRNELHGNIKLIFQPDEEENGGAKNLIEYGCLHNPEVDRVIGLHVEPSLPCGAIETKYGAMYATSDMINITIKGKSAHGAHPEKGIDAIAAVAQVITAFQTVVSRNVSPTDSVVLSIGTINGGTARNIICNKVSMKAALRTINENTRAIVIKRICDIINGISSSLGCSAEINFLEGYPSLVNDKETVDTIFEAAGELLGKENVYVKEKITLGVEDFSYYINACKGAYYHLGCSNSEKGITAPLHSNNFDIDENCLKLGVMLHAAVAYKLLEC